MGINRPNNEPQQHESASETGMQMPNEHPQKQGLFATISDMLRNLSSSLGLNKLFGMPENNEKTNPVQEFFAKMLGIFHGVNIEKWVTVERAEDIEKIREAFRPILDLDETGIILNQWDFIIYNKNTGTVDIYPSDANSKNGHSDTISGTISVTPRKIPAKTPEEVEEDYKNKTSTSKTLSESNNIKATEMSQKLGRWLAQRGSGPNTGPNSCGPAVDALLTEFGIKNSTPHPAERRDGKNFYRFLSNDPRFKLITVTSLSEIPPGGIMTYNWKWKLNGRPNGSHWNQKFGHVEIRDTNGIYYSFGHGTRHPGGSAKEPQLEKNFEKWKEATGFTGVFVPIAKTKAEARKMQS